MELLRWDYLPEEGRMKRNYFALAAASALKCCLALWLLETQAFMGVFDFVSGFTVGQSPWTAVAGTEMASVFPYPAGMLYIYKLVHIVYGALGGGLILARLLYVLPILGAELVGYFALSRLFEGKSAKILFFYFLSPVLLYAGYVEGHLDSIAVACVLVALCALNRRKPLRAAIYLAVGFSIKLPVLFVLPLIVVYLYRNYPENALRTVGTFLGVFTGAALGIALPFVFQTSYMQGVLFNPQQSLFYTLALPMGGYAIYIAYLAVLALYGRFAVYGKINRYLLYNFLALVFSVFVLLVPPAANWYVWSWAFCSVLFVGLLDRHKTVYALSLGFSVLYLLTFAVKGQMGTPHMHNLLFTTFEATLLFTVYILYHYGVRSNSVYMRREHATVIGIGGDSGTGKSTLSRALMDLLGSENVVPLEADGDHRWARGDAGWTQMTHLNPKANFLYRQAAYLKRLKMGEVIERADYDHNTGTFTAPRRVFAKDYIIISGLHPFYLPQTREIVDFKIYMDTDEALRRHWKLCRDIAERGYSAEKVLRQLAERESDAEHFIYPQRAFSDMQIRLFAQSDFNIGDTVSHPDMGLEISLPLDVDLEPMVERLQGLSYPLVHTYGSDMLYQTLRFERPVSMPHLEALAQELIYTADELISGHRPQWAEGYLGIMQLMTLLLIDTRMRRVKQ